MTTKTKKKILYVITKSNWGGAQRYVYDLATSMPKDSFDVAVAHGGEGELSGKLKETGIRTIHVPCLLRDIRIGQEIKMLFALVRLFQKERPDVVHLNSSKIGGLGAFSARIAGVPKIIFTAHGWAFKEERWWPAKKLILFFSWLTVLLAHRTIAVSRDDKNRRPQLFSAKKTTLVHNGIESYVFVERNKARIALLKHLEKTAAPTDDTVWIGTISELHTNKGLAYSITAMRDVVRACPNVLFVIMGEGDERPLLEQCIKENRLVKHVFLAGHIHDAPSLLPAFDIVTLTSIKEGLPYVLLEAGCAGMPVLASNVGGIPDIVEHEKTGILVRPKHSKEITQALLYLIENKNRREVLGAALQKNIRNNFTKERMVEETLKVYAMEQ